MDLRCPKEIEGVLAQDDEVRPYNGKILLVSYAQSRNKMVLKVYITFSTEIT